MSVMVWAGLRNVCASVSPPNIIVGCRNVWVEKLTRGAKTQPVRASLKVISILGGKTWVPGKAMYLVSPLTSLAGISRDTRGVLRRPRVPEAPTKLFLKCSHFGVNTHTHTHTLTFTAPFCGI